MQDGQPQERKREKVQTEEKKGKKKRNMFRFAHATSSSVLAFLITGFGFAYNRWCRDTIPMPANNFYMHLCRKVHSYGRRRGGLITSSS